MVKRKHEGGLEDADCGLCGGGWAGGSAKLVFDSRLRGEVWIHVKRRQVGLRMGWFWYY